MLSTNQAENFKMRCAQWLEIFLKAEGPAAIKDVYTVGKKEGFTRVEIKAARAWHGKWITTIDNTYWSWDADDRSTD